MLTEEELADYLWIVIGPEQVGTWSEETAREIARYVRRAEGLTLRTTREVVAYQRVGMVLRDKEGDVLEYMNGEYGDELGWYCTGTYTKFNADEVILPAEVLYCVPAEPVE